MLTGILNTENYTQALRDISHRRRQGVLQITFADRQLEIMFIQGRICEVVEVGEPPVQDLAKRMIRCGIMPPGDINPTSYKDLGEYCVEHHISPELYRSAVSERVFHKLYELDLSASAYFNFNVKMVDCEKDLLPSISVGQLLLEIVALKDEDASFEASYSPHTILQTDISDFSSQAIEDRWILSELKRPTRLFDLEDRSFISRFHLRERLAALIEKGLVKVVTPGAKSKVQEADVANFVEAFGKTLDDSFENSLYENDSEDELTENKAVTGTLSGPTVVGEPSTESEVDSPSMTLNARLGAWNAKMLASNAIVNILTLGFLLAAVLCPLLLWLPMFKTTFVP